MAQKSLFVLAILLALASLPACGSDPAPAATDAKTSGDSVADSAADSGSADASPTDTAPVDAAADVSPAVKPVLPPAKPADALVVLTYNVMCSFCINSDHMDWDQKWLDRVPWLRDVFMRMDADLMGIQELQATLPTKTGKPEAEELFGENSPWAYAYHHATPTNAEDHDYPDALVAWKKDRFDKLEQGEFWLSPTPDVPLSWGLAGKAQFARLVLWVKLHDKVANRDLYFASTHFDNNAPSQEKSSPIALERLGPLTKNAPLIVTGDFNSNPSTKAYALLVAGQENVSPPWQDTFVAAKTWSMVHNQPSAPAYDPQTRIDHIFVVGPKATVAWWGIDFWRYGEKFQAPSDHDGAIVSYIQLP